MSNSFKRFPIQYCFSSLVVNCRLVSGSHHLTWGRTVLQTIETYEVITARKMKFFIKEFFSKCDQILKKSLMENFIFCAVYKKLSIFRSSRFQIFFKIGVLKNFANFLENHMCRSLFFDKVARLRSATLLKKRLWQSRFTMNSVKSLRWSEWNIRMKHCQFSEAVFRRFSLK